MIAYHNKCLYYKLQISCLFKQTLYMGQKTNQPIYINLKFYLVVMQAKQKE